MKTTKIDTTRFYRSHMTTPRGRGGWLFEGEDGAVIFRHAGTYTEAVKAARAWGTTQGIEVLYTCP